MISIIIALAIGSVYAQPVAKPGVEKIKPKNYLKEHVVARNVNELASIGSEETNQKIVFYARNHHPKRSLLWHLSYDAAKPSTESERLPRQITEAAKRMNLKHGRNLNIHGEPSKTQKGTKSTKMNEEFLFHIPQFFRFGFNKDTSKNLINVKN